MRAATLAARDARVPVTVVDTGTASFGVAICVIAAAESLAAGGSVAEVSRRIHSVAAGIGTVFVAGGAPNGRITASPGLPLLTFVSGETRPVGSATDLDDAADALAEQLALSPGFVDVTRYRVGPSVGAHTGSLSFGAFWWKP